MQLDQKALIEEAVQASIDAGLAVNGEHGVAAARHAARFMFNALQAVQPVPVGTEALTLARDYIIGLGQSPDAEGWPRDQYAVMAAIEAALTATASAEPVVHDGWQLVPKEPTDDMLKALLNQSDWSVARAFRMYSGARAFWKAMLAATPLPAQGGNADE